MKELNVLVLGDRIMFMEFLKLLKKHKRDADRSKSLWSGTTPVLSLAYHKNCGQFCFHVSCIATAFLDFVQASINDMPKCATSNDLSNDLTLPPLP